MVWNVSIKRVFWVHRGFVVVVVGLAGVIVVVDVFVVVVVYHSLQSDRLSNLVHFGTQVRRVQFHCNLSYAVGVKDQLDF